MGHGLGGLMINRFLESISPEWKRKYVHVFVPVAVPWAGSVMALYDYETGGFLKTDSYAKKIQYWEIYRSWETAELLLPHGQAWNNTVPFYKNYDINSYWLHFKKNVQPRHPGVNIIALLSTGVPTINSFDLHDESFPSSKHTFGYGDGDGRVNSCSLHYNHHLKSNTGFSYLSFECFKINHQEVLSSKCMRHVMRHINGE